jgi:hypothetical protein
MATTGQRFVVDDADVSVASSAKSVLGNNLVGIFGAAFLFGLIAANYGRDALHSAQRGVATAGLILGFLAALVGGIWFGQHWDELQNLGQSNTQGSQ